MNKKSLVFNYQIIVIYILAFITLIFSQIIVSLFIDIESLSSAQFYFVNALMNLFLYGGLTVIFLWFARIYLFKNQWVYFTRNLAYSILLFGLGMYLLFAANFVAAGVLELVSGPIDPANQNAINELLKSGPVNASLVFMFAVLFAPFVEEIVFRKGVYGLINARLNTVFAILGSALIFSVIHVTGEMTGVLTGASSIGQLLLTAFPYFLLGNVLAFVYYYSGKKIWIVIFMHMLYNLLSLLASFMV
ncbi:MAG: CPBP family intramembrane glutamic endopeptidase [Candidatus Izemoplasmataceae bacterium]